MEPVLCFLGYLLLNLEAAAFAPMRRISFRVFRMVRGYIPSAATGSVVTALSESEGPEIVEDMDTSPNQPLEATGVSARGWPWNFSFAASVLAGASADR